MLLFKKLSLFLFNLFFLVISGFTQHVVHLSDLGGEQPDENIYASSKLPDRIMLNWSGDPATSQSVTWRTDSSVINSFGQVTKLTAMPPEPERIDTIFGTHKSLVWINDVAHYHTVRFNDLEPGTWYLYRIGDGKHWSEWNRFRTADAEPNDFSFIYMGDAQNDIKEFWSQIIRGATLSTSNARFMLFAGDLTLSSGGDYSWGEWFDGAGWIFRTIPTIPSSGNSDHIRLSDPTVDTRMLYPQYLLNFDTPDNGPKGYEDIIYYVDYQGVRFISLYSNFESIEPGKKIILDANRVITEDFIPMQTAWLESVLKDNPNRYTIAVFHHPVHSARETRENDRLRNAWKPLFDKYGVDLVLQGHDHLYARGQINGTGPVYMISHAGPKMGELDETGVALHWTSKTGENMQLWQVVRVKSDRIVINTFKENAILFDTFTVMKGQDGKIELIEGELE